MRSARRKFINKQKSRYMYVRKRALKLLKRIRHEIKHHWYWLRKSIRFGLFGDMKRWRFYAHCKLDPLWQYGIINRDEAYVIIQDLFNMSEEEAHIANLTKRQCKELIQYLDETSLGVIRSKEILKTRQIREAQRIVLENSKNKFINLNDLKP